MTEAWCILARAGRALAANPGETKNLPGLLIVCSDYDYYHNDKGNYHDA